MVANVQVVQPLRQRSAGPLGCSWGAHAERTPLVSLCVVLVSYPVHLHSLLMLTLQRQC